MLGVRRELHKNTVLHVRWWLVEHITRFADWLLGRVHVMQWCWLDNQWGGNRLCTWSLHDQCMCHLGMWSGNYLVEDWCYSAHSELNIHTVYLQLLMLREHSNSTCYKKYNFNIKLLNLRVFTLCKGKKLYRTIHLNITASTKFLTRNYWKFKNGPLVVVSFSKIRKIQVKVLSLVPFFLQSLMSLWAFIQ